MRKINKIKNLSGLLDLASIPQYQDGGYIQEYNIDDIIPNYSKGGIHIKKKNRGKFTETMKRTGKTAEELKHSKNPLTRKRATFAINARKWAKNK